MNHFLNIFGQNRSIFLLIFYLILCFVIMSFNDTFQLRGVRFIVLQGIAWINSIENKINYFRDLEKDNQNLRKNLLELSLTNQRMKEQMLENLRLKKLLNFQEESPYTFISASVIGLGQEQSIRSLILNVGKHDSVQKNYTVLTPNGLVGKVLKVEPHQSIIQILMDPNSLVSARLQRSREIGVMAWSGNLWLDFNYIPKDVIVEPGEAVLTSGLSRIYPAGLKIGVVAEVQDNEYELFKKIKIKPAVNFNQLEDVFVLIAPDTLREIE
jgi:rod shape-determining protein MreC